MKKAPLLYLATLPADIFGWLIVIFVRICWGHGLQWKHGVLCCELKENSWPQRTWYKNWGGTTFGHAIMYAHGHMEWEPIWHHELVHVEQFEAECIQNLVLLGVSIYFGMWWVGLAWLTWAPLVGVLSGLATAWLRGEDPYRGSHLEEAARAVATCRKRNIEV